MTFINSKKAFRFYNGTLEKKIPAQYVGEVPDWVTETRLFKLAVSDSSITYVGESRTQVVKPENFGSTAPAAPETGKTKGNGKA
jgi:hypothetical protein